LRERSLIVFEFGITGEYGRASAYKIINLYNTRNYIFICAGAGEYGKNYDHTQKQIGHPAFCDRMEK
jgi:hypothetical protein